MSAIFLNYRWRYVRSSQALEMFPGHGVIRVQVQCVFQVSRLTFWRLNKMRQQKPRFSLLRILLESIR